MAPVEIQGQRKVILAHIPHLRAAPLSEVQNSSMLPQDQIQHTPLVAGAKTHPEAVRNGPLRRESVAETTSWVAGPRSAFLQKQCAYASIVVG